MDKLLSEIVKNVNKFLLVHQQKLGMELKLSCYKDQMPAVEFIEKLRAIEKESFKTELRYNLAEFDKMFKYKNPILLVISSQDKPIAFIIGYDEPNVPQSYYMDTGATLVEKSRLIKAMAVVLYIWGFYNKYKYLRLHAEEIDYRGNSLIDIYSGQGFKELKRDEHGVYMSVDITKERMEAFQKEFAQK